MSALSFQRTKHDAPGDGVFDALEQATLAGRGHNSRANPDAPDLDSDAVQGVFKQCRGLYLAELERQADNRKEMETDEAFYDGDQWSADELETLAARGQAPTVYNMIQTSVNWMLGTQRRSAMDYKILPRREDGAESAQRKTELFAHVRDMNHSQRSRSAAFADAVKVGLGWLETGQSDEEDGALVFDRSPSWRSILWDSLATEENLQDSRFISRTKWLDFDHAKVLWPDRLDVIRRSVHGLESGGSAPGDEEMADSAMDSVEFMESNTIIGRTGNENIGTLRPRLRVIEFWFKRLENVPIMRGGQFNGEVYDEWSEGHWNEISTETATVVTRPRETVWLMMMTEKGVLDLRRSPYRHNRYPFTPVWGYRRAADNMPYGVIRSMRPINQAINKYASKGLHAISSNKLYVQEGSVDDIEDTRDEMARPDGVVVYKQGFGAPVRETDTTTPALMDGFFSRDAALMQSISGITDEAMGRTTNATSGKAIVARQDQGALATSSLFDGLRFAELLHGEKILVNIEQFYDREMQFRILDDKDKPLWKKINDTPATSITGFKADFVISQDEWRATVRQAQVSQLMDLMMQMAPVAPQLVLGMLPTLLGMMDIPKAQEFARMARELTGAPDPDEDPNNPSPETVARNEAAAKQQAMQDRMMEAEVSGKESAALKARAEAKLKGDQSTRERVQQQVAALEASGILAADPRLAAVADAIMAAAMSDGEDMAAQAGDMPVIEQPPAMPAPAADPAMQGGMV